MGCGRTVGIVFPSRTSHASGAIAWANWCKLTARSTPGLRTADRRVPLLAFVDDATSRLMQLRFAASESAFDYFRSTRAYLEVHRLESITSRPRQSSLKLCHKRRHD